MPDAIASIPPVRHLSFDPSLDGVRGVAVLAVLGLHLGLFAGGNSGVTLFFTLSGFLITGLLVQEHDAAGGVNLTHFYVRRGLRLLPALFLVLAVDIVFVLCCRQGYELKAGLAAAGATLCYSANWCLAFKLLPMRQISHTWSLAVEEQFYLAWPLLVMVLLRLRLSRRWLASLIALAGAAFVAERFLLAAWGATEARLYNGLDTRADALLFGAAAAFVFRHRMFGESGWQRRTLGWAGAVCACLLAAHLFLGLGAVPRSVAFASIGSYTVVALLSAVLILALTCGASGLRLVRPVLRFAPFQYTGKISYGLYLWHYLVFAILEDFNLVGNGWGGVVVKVAMAFLVAAVSFHFFEKPCLGLKSRFARPGVSGASRAIRIQRIASQEAV
jgi:peptidoglycan/LPS O-acetylase OafA/YrhL